MDNIMRHPHIDCTAINDNDLLISITDINLCVNFSSQGVCDEAYGLTVVPTPKQRYPTDPPRANHFSFWLGFGGNSPVMLDVTQRHPPSNPYATDYVETCPLSAIVRLTPKTIPTDDDIGCVLRAFDVQIGTTLGDIVRVIISRNRHQYSFFPIHKQQAGCRYWIYTLAKDLEDLGITGKGYASDVFQCLQTYYSRFPIKLQNGRWDQGGNWASRPEFHCAPLIPGYFFV